MQTIRLGSVGVDVQAWQRAIGIVADGVFGPKTRAMTVAFQTTHHLTADGVVGTETWRAVGLAPKAVVLEGVDLSVAQAGARVDFERAYQAGIRFVVVRTQAGEAAADSTLMPFLTGARAASHLVSVYQYALPDEDPADDVDALMKAIGDVELDFPAWLDLETMNGRSASQVIDWGQGWKDRYLELRGHRPSIYSGQGFWSTLGPVCRLLSHLRRLRRRDAAHLRPIQARALSSVRRQSHRPHHCELHVAGQDVLTWRSRVGQRRARSHRREVRRAHRIARHRRRHRWRGRPRSLLRHAR